MTVAENMAFALRIKKVSDSEIKRRVGEVAASLGLEPYLERKPKALSGGQRQRVAIGRAVVRQPKVFLFDEPLSNLDAKLRGDMRREIARIHQMSKATGMYVTHDQIEAMTLGDQIVVLKDGIVQQVGSPVEIYETPANRFVAGFFGTPTMNFLAADLAQTGDRHLARGPGFEIPLSLAPALRPAQSGLDRLRTPSGSAARPGRAEACDRLRTPSGSAARPGRAEACDRVVVGIRPEQLSLTRRSEGVSLRGEVAMREILGAEIVLHLESQSGPLTVRTEAGSAPRPGDTVEVWLDPSRIHVFDGNSEVRL
jgi:multiple sugar transport system ATP-binding protein